MHYRPQDIEAKWQKVWDETKVYRTSEGGDKPKFFCLDFFPYPSGAGLTVGHYRNYVPTDAISRFKRMRGYNVLHPMGWDAFGQPAETEAIAKKRHPRPMVEEYIGNYKRQLHIGGFCYDWERELNSSHPEYYRWTQWIFLQLYKRGLAYRTEAPVNWCPKEGLVLANEEAKDGKCWRCNSDVTKKNLVQWFFRITAYADRLADDLSTVDWPDKIVTMQRNWIGRSEGAEFDMQIRGHAGKTMRVFTTRPDTVFGMTFCVLAPEHPLVAAITTAPQKQAVNAYVEKTLRQSEIDRQSTEKERDGVFTGAYAVNPMNGEDVPIYVADYVLLGYGTGAIMAVPGHDTRDFDFARKYNLPIPVVIAPPNWDGKPLDAAYTGDGAMVNSGPFNGLVGKEGIARVAAKMEEMAIGQRKVHYKMRDWLISRQRYWGAPIPIVHCARCGEVAVPEDQLPVLLPDIDAYEPTGDGRSPLANVPAWVNTTCPTCGGAALRETDTMGGFACSSWYFMRFASPRYDKAFAEPSALKYWLPVDLYVGGAEHAVMHLLFARFWTKVMFDAGHIHFNEPFSKLMNQGMLLASDGQKMSKSRPATVVIPETVVARFGADAVRCYEMFMGPFDQEVQWDEKGLAGLYRFLSRVWEIVITPRAGHAASAGDADAGLRKMTHKTINRVTIDLDRLHFNTMIAALMEFINYLQDARTQAVSAAAWNEATDALLLMLAPAAPHLAEELWQHKGHAYSIHQQAWPEFDAGLIVDETITLIVQVGGKVRDKLVAPTDISEADAKLLALSSERVKPWLAGKTLGNVVYVPGKLVNISVK
jgi:leucyl-tRNA synthetase